MEISSSVWHLLRAGFIVLVGVFVSVVCAIRFGVSRSRALVIYKWHSIFSMAYFWGATLYGGDAIVHFPKAYDA